MGRIFGTLGNAADVTVAGAVSHHAAVGQIAWPESQLAETSFNLDTKFENCGRRYAEHKQNPWLWHSACRKTSITRTFSKAFHRGRHICLLEVYAAKFCLGKRDGGSSSAPCKTMQLCYVCIDVLPYANAPAWELSHIRAPETSIAPMLLFVTHDLLGSGHP